MSRALFSPLLGGESSRPSFLAGSLFLLLFSGPPRLRERDPVASLRGDIDAVVILHVVVWVAAGLWVFYQMRFYFQDKSKPLKFGLAQCLGLGLIGILGLSSLISVAPFLTIFIVYQMFVSMMF